MHFLQCHKCIVVNENTWKIKQNILFTPAFGYRLLSSSHWVMPNTLQPYGQQHTRVPSPSLLLRVCSNSGSLSWWCHPTILSSFVPLSTCLPSFPSIRVFFSELALHIRWPKYWSFSFIISPSKENSGLISFRIDWFDLLAVQGTLNNFLQNHSSKASVLQCSAFFLVQPSHWYMTTGKIIGLTTWTLSVKWCLCFLIFCLGFLQLLFPRASVF